MKYSAAAPVKIIVLGAGGTGGKAESGKRAGICFKANRAVGRGA